MKVQDGPSVFFSNTTVCHHDFRTYWTHVKLERENQGSTARLL
jgi:hypothetical protein